MARRKQGTPPSYGLHKPSGKAVFKWPLGGGQYRSFYLGPHGSPESYAEYNRLVAEWSAAKGAPPAHTPGSPTDVSITELYRDFLEWATAHYPSPQGHASSELANLKDALKPLRQLYGHTAAQSFGPLALQALQQHLVTTGLCRTTINARINRVRRLFKWAVAQEKLSAEVYVRLQTVQGLQLGRGHVRESEPVEPVALDVVTATLPYLPTPVAAMVRLQVLTGCRPSEAMALTPSQLKRDGQGCWEYRPAHHKNKHRGKPRVIFLGPEAQQLLAPFLDQTGADTPLFSPQAATQEMRARRRASRKTKVQPSQLDRRTPNPKRQPAEQYNRRSYYQAIQRAVAQANAVRDGQGLCALPSWGPLQLRHTAATQIQAQFGLETARVILGHSRVETTQIYAARDLDRAAQAMAKVG
jgi:integrase